MRVTTADFIKNYGPLADKAAAEPVTITEDGKDILVLVSAAEYDRLRRRDRRAMHAEELSTPMLELVETAEGGLEHGHLDAELADWRP